MNVIKELWHGNIVPQEDSRNNSAEMKQLMEYMARHHEELEKSFTDEQKEIFEKFDVASQKQLSVVFDAAKPPKQRVGRAEQAQVIGDDYATVEKSWREYMSLAEAAIFEYAFKLGARLTMEVQKDT